MAHNPNLAEKQGLNETETETIDKLHLLRSLIEVNTANLMERQKLEQNGFSYVNIIQNNYIVWFENEMLLQKIWKFDNPSHNFIKFWSFPACSCPKYENNLLYPNGEYHTDVNCLIHGIKEN